MSTLSYIAGASVERNINEAVRIQEELAHGEQLRNLTYRFQLRIDELYEENKSLRNLLGMKSMLIGEQRAKIEKLDKEKESAREYVRQLRKRISANEMIAHVMSLEVENFKGKELHEIIEKVASVSGEPLSDEARAYINERANMNFRFSSDGMMQAHFFVRLSQTLVEREKSGNPIKGDQALIDLSIQIAKTLIAESDRKKVNEVKGKADFATFDAKV